jgi:hypothetical protein
MMKLKVSMLILVVFALLGTACDPGDQDQPTQVIPSITPPTEPADTIAPTEILKITDVPPAETPSSVDPTLPLSKYSLSVFWDYDSHTGTVDQQISYINTSGTELSEVLVLIEPNQYPGGFVLEELKWENGETISDYSLQGRELRIPTPAPLSPGEALGIQLIYQVNLPNQNAPYGYTERQTNLGDWYPYIPPYIPGEGWLVRDDAYLGEHLAYDMADFEVEIQLASSYAANGAELIIAASSLPEIAGEIYHYHHTPARNFVWTVSDQYQLQETMVGDVMVKSYSFPYHPQADGPALEETAKALSIFDELFSPYPHKILSVVEADFLDGMEYDGLIFLSHAFYDYYTGDQRSNLTIIAAHEVAHQWWYGLVGNDQALEPWLDEALSTFSELYFYESAYPEYADWWWQNRIFFHEPQGWVDSSIYEVAGFYPYRDAVYLRGAMFLGEVRDLLGEEAFLDFLRDYLTKYSYQQANGDDFFNLLSAHTSADLSGLISSYFNHR